MGTREAVAARPAGPLGDVVHELHGYRERGVAPARHLGLPSPWITVIFTLDEPLQMARHVDPAQPPGDYAALVGGLHTSPAVIVHDGAQSGIQLSVSPLGSRALFGVPAGELAETDVDADRVFGRLADEVLDRMRSAPDWAGRFAVLERHLGAVVADVRPVEEVCHAWHLLLSAHGTVPVATIARVVGWSERHLASRFRTEIGLTPKAAARVVRFDRARRRLRAGNGAEVAAECGFFDQSHLVREFVAFTGLSPRAWLAAEVGNVQARPADGAAQWAS